MVKLRRGGSLINKVTLSSSQSPTAVWYMMTAFCYMLSVVCVVQILRFTRKEKETNYLLKYFKFVNSWILNLIFLVKDFQINFLLLLYLSSRVWQWLIAKLQTSTVQQFNSSTKKSGWHYFWGVVVRSFVVRLLFGCRNGQ